MAKVQKGDDLDVRDAEGFSELFPHSGCIQFLEGGHDNPFSSPNRSPTQ